MPTQILDPHFNLGFQSDVSRDLLPEGAAYRMYDWIPDLEAPARKRGGYTYASRALAAGARVQTAAWVPFPDDPHLMIINNLGNVYVLKDFNVGPETAASGIASHANSTEKPFWWKDRMIILQGLTVAAAAPHKYTGSGGVYTVAALGGTPPQARIGAAWGDYVLLGNGHDGTSERKNRLWWSGPGNSESWSVGAGGSWFDMPEEVIKVVTLRSITLAFGYSQVWLLTGDTPPPGGNLALKDLFTTGMADPRSLARYRDYVIWANNSGVWRSDGTTLTDLTENGGISLYWQALMAGFSLQQGYSCVAGQYRGYYFVTIKNAVGSPLATLVCDIDRYVWFEITNFDATVYAERISGPGTSTVAGSEELFFGRYGAARVAKVSPLWTPDSSNIQDANSVTVLPVLETRFHKVGVYEKKRIRRIYIGYDMRSAGQAAVLQPSFVLSPYDTAYTNTPEGLPTTTRYLRDRATIARRTEGIGIKITQTGPSNDTKLYGLEAEGYAISEQR